MIVRLNKLYESVGSQNAELKVSLFRDSDSNHNTDGYYKQFQRNKSMCRTIDKKIKELGDIISDYSVSIVGDVYDIRQTNGVNESYTTRYFVEKALIDEDMLKKYTKVKKMDILLSFSTSYLDVKDVIRVMNVIHYIYSNYCYESDTKVVLNDCNELFGDNILPITLNNEYDSQRIKLFFMAINKPSDEDVYIKERNRIDSRNTMHHRSYNIFKQLGYSFMEHNVSIEEKVDNNFIELRLSVHMGDKVSDKELAWIIKVYDKYICPECNMIIYIDIEGTLVVNGKTNAWMNDRRIVDFFVANIENHSQNDETYYRKMIKR